MDFRDEMKAGTTSGGKLRADAADYFDLLNLVHGYADALDRGDFDQIGEMFRHANVYMPGSIEPEVRAGSGEFNKVLRDAVRVYLPGNTPRTRHVTTNDLIVFESQTCARMRSYFTVLQQVSPGSLQPVICGTYDDRFSKIDDEWCFIERREAVTASGDLSAHLRVAMNYPVDN